MSSRFKITHRKKHGNLHVFPEGIFDGNSAWELINLLVDKDVGNGRIFIDTRRLEDVCAFGCHTFKTYMDFRVIDPSRLYFKGAKGFDLAPSGSRVIVVPTRGKIRMRPEKPLHEGCPGCRKSMGRAVGE